MKLKFTLFFFLFGLIGSSVAHAQLFVNKVIILNEGHYDYTNQVQTVPVGFLMTVTPHIADNHAIQLRVRPTLSRIVGFVQDPNPALQQLNIVSKVPEVQTRELESILRLKSGEMA